MKATSHRLLGQGAASLRFQTAQVLKFSPLKNSRRTYLFTRIFIPEALLSLRIGASLFLFLTALEVDGSSPWRWYAGYASAALAVLTKGLVGMVFVGLSAAGYLFLSGEWRRWKKFRLASGLGLFLLLAAPWHILAGIRNRGFFWFYFINEHFLRFLGKRYPMDYNKLPALAYWGLLLVWLFPWSLYLTLVLRNLRRDLLPARNSAVPGSLSFQARTRLLCWVWTGVVLLFFAFSTNQEYYIFLAYLPLLILLAGAVSAARLRWTCRRNSTARQSWEKRGSTTRPSSSGENSLRQILTMPASTTISTPLCKKVADMRKRSPSLRKGSS